MLPTDSFEFLAEYYGAKGVRFVSELTGLTSNPLDNGILHEGDELEWKREPENKYDSKAVLLLKDGRALGYVKKIHSRVFYLLDSHRLKAKVKKIEYNGHLSRVFIVIYDSKSR